MRTSNRRPQVLYRTHRLLVGVDLRERQPRRVINADIYIFQPAPCILPYCESAVILTGKVTLTALYRLPSQNGAAILQRSWPGSPKPARLQQTRLH